MNFLTKLHRAFSRTPRPSGKAKDSTPSAFSRRQVAEMAAARAKHIEDAAVLRWLNKSKLQQMAEDVVDGYWAGPQWIWERLEKTDSHVIIAIRNRDARLKEYELTCQPLEELSDADAALADAQCATMRDLIAGISNMKSAVAELSVASRRHYTFLQPVIDGADLRLESIPRWLIARDGYLGAWRWNPTASTGSVGHEAWPVPFASLIGRVCDTPLDLPASHLALNRSTTYAQWDCFLEALGVPPMFIVGPEGISEEEHKLYVKAALACLSNAKGYMPHGTTLLSPTVPATNVEMFSRRIQLANDELLMLMTGSTLTTATAPDSGTLAGSAHTDTADMIAAAEVDEIADVLQRGLLMPTLADYHPQQPVLCQLVMRKAATPTVGEEIANIALLRTAGYSVDLDQAKARTGWELKEQPPTPSMYEAKAVGYRPTQEGIEQMTGLPMEAAPAEVMAPTVAYQTHRAKELKLALHRNRSRILYAPSRAKYELAMHSAIKQAEDNAPLSEEELALAQEMASATLDMEQVRRDALYVYNGLERALKPEMTNAPQDK